MHFLLVLLQLLVERLFPAWRDGLTLAARSDGRVERVPIDLWSRWCQWWRQPTLRTGAKAAKRTLTGDAARSPRPRA